LSQSRSHAAPEEQPASGRAASGRKAPLGSAPVPVSVAGMDVRLLQKLAGNRATSELLSAQRKIQQGGEELEDLQKTVVPVAVRPVEVTMTGAAGTVDASLAKAATAVAGGAAPSHTLGGNDYGLTFPESVSADIDAGKNASGDWVPVVTRLTGNYSQQVRLLPGQSEVTGPGGNTTQANACAQVTGLTTLGNTAGNPWYMLSAVQAHEDVHLTRFQPALDAGGDAIATNLEPTAKVPAASAATKADAITKLRADPAFAAALTSAFATWLAKAATMVAGDHAAGGPCDVAEHGVVDPMVTRICDAVKANEWPACPGCP